MAGKKQAPAKQAVEEEEEAEGWEDAVVDADGKEAADLRLRDWRDVERYREMKDLRRLVDDDYGLEEIFHIPLRPRNEPALPGARTPAHKPSAAGKPLPSGKGAPAAKTPATDPKAAKPAQSGKVASPAKAPAPAKHAPKPATVTKHAAKAHPKVKAKAKRR